MFDPYLTCRTFALTETHKGWQLEIARRWSRDAKLAASSDGSIHWTSRANTEIVKGGWYLSPVHVDVEVHTALVPLGEVDKSEVFAIVSPISVITSAFKAAVSPYLCELRDNKRAPVLELTLDLERAATEGWKRLAPIITGVIGTGSNGEKISWAASPESMDFPPDNGIVNWKSVKLLLNNRHAIVDKHFNVRLDDVSEEFSDAAELLINIFSLFHNFLATTKIAREHKFG